MNAIDHIRAYLVYDVETPNGKRFTGITIIRLDREVLE